ncbi:hypothetical protein KAH94_03600 [bacterium]|nr:hypothetical protein [bacterium]
MKKFLYVFLLILFTCCPFNIQCSANRILQFGEDTIIGFIAKKINTTVCTLFSKKKIYPKKIDLSSIESHTFDPEKCHESLKFIQKNIKNIKYKTKVHNVLLEKKRQISNKRNVQKKHPQTFFKNFFFGFGSITGMLAKQAPSAITSWYIVAQIKKNIAPSIDNYIEKIIPQKDYAKKLAIATIMYPLGKMIGEACKKTFTSESTYKKNLTKKNEATICDLVIKLQLEKYNKNLLIAQLLEDNHAKENPAPFSKNIFDEKFVVDVKSIEDCVALKNIPNINRDIAILDEEKEKAEKIADDLLNDFYVD